MEGVESHGVRTTATLPAGQLGNKKPKTVIHEVWTSTSAHLVMKVIDGDPQNEESISGLEDVTLSPDAAQFNPPGRIYEVQYTSESKYADPDIVSFAKWFVKQPPVNGDAAGLAGRTCSPRARSLLGLMRENTDTAVVLPESKRSLSGEKSCAA